MKIEFIPGFEDYAAFQDGNLGYELASMLRLIADRLEFEDRTSGTMYDSNGNKVGTWSL